MNSRPGHVRSTPGCCRLNVPARPASLRIQSLSGSRTRPWMRTGGELQPCALATLGSRPRPAPCASPCAPSPASPTGARALMPGLLGAPYGMTQACYDLARLRRNGLITRRPHANTYDLTPDGLAFAIFYTKVHDRVLAPLFAAGQPQSTPQLRAASHRGYPRLAPVAPGDIDPTRRRHHASLSGQTSGGETRATAGGHAVQLS